MSSKYPGFHNPYNFVPLCDPVADGQLSQREPPGHHVYGTDLFEGRIEVELTAASPLLLLDPSKTCVANNDHRTVDLLTNAQGQPILRPTSLKGALRAAYEAITCSRLGVFQGHDRPLARRMDARAGLSMVPARVSKNGKELELYLGNCNRLPASKDGRWAVPGNTMYAAWLPRYWRGTRKAPVSCKHGPVIAKNAVTYPKSGGLPRHGDQVDCWLKLVNHRSRNFMYWRVVYIQIAGSGHTMPTRVEIEQLHGTHCEYLSITNGYVCVTNQNIGRKHDERVFFASPGPAPRRTIKLNEQWPKDWNYLIEDYQREHEDDLRKRARNKTSADAYLGHRPGQTAWSRHVIEKKTAVLRPGDLCYARVDQCGAVIGLYPVMISRELAKKNPHVLLPEKLRPAEQLDQLSAADRVFGWVRQGKGDAQRAGGPSAYKGHVRIRRVTCLSSKDDAVHRFEDPGLPLATLASPKPQQALFYAAGAPNYDKAETLSGRKFYLHHRGVPDDYWSSENAISDANGRGSSPGSGVGVFREYVRRGDQGADRRDNQNCSIRAWVKIGTKFSAEIRFDNLNAAELGALLWLCNLGEGRHMKIGTGKPLGFGSVTTTITDLEIRDREAMRAEYAVLVPTSSTATSTTAGHLITCPQSACKHFVAKFKDALCGGRSELEHHPAVAAFLAMAKGAASGRVQYPRVSPDPSGENYQWFVENLKQEKPCRLPGPGGPLLPYYSKPSSPPASKRRSMNGRRRGRRRQRS